jgi:hypothetical protein
MLGIPKISLLRYPESAKVAPRRAVVLIGHFRKLVDCSRKFHGAFRKFHWLLLKSFKSADFPSFLFLIGQCNPRRDGIRKIKIYESPSWPSENASLQIVIVKFLQFRFDAGVFFQILHNIFSQRRTSWRVFFLRMK